MRIVTFHRPDGKEVKIIADDVESWTEGEQVRGPNHNTTIYLISGFRDVKESVAEVERMLTSP